MKSYTYFTFPVLQKTVGVVLKGTSVISIILGTDEKLIAEKIKQEHPYSIRKTEKSIKYALLQYLSGKSRHIDIPFQLINLSDLQKKILKKTSCIPYGEICPYSELAKNIGNPALARFVGSTLAKNPVPLIIPCHRVIKKSGSTGGFIGSAKDNTGWKTLLLRLEKENIKKTRGV